jgi:hypothetical protein
MRQIFIVVVLFAGINGHSQERQLSVRARDLTQALAALRASTSDSQAQGRYLTTFPHDYKEFLNLFDLGHELSDGADYIDALSLTEEKHPTELGRLLVGLAKDAHYDADAPSYLQHLTAVYAGKHAEIFIELFDQLPPQKQTQLITFLADVENHGSYPEYQAIIDAFKRLGEGNLAIRFEKARAKREKHRND